MKTESNFTIEDSSSRKDSEIEAILNRILKLSEEKRQKLLESLDELENEASEDIKHLEPDPILAEDHLNYSIDFDH